MFENKSYVLKFERSELPPERLLLGFQEEFFISLSRSISPNETHSFEIVTRIESSVGNGIEFPVVIQGNVSNCSNI